MTTPSLVLRGERPYSSPAKYTVNFAISSNVELTTKPGVSGPFTMRATRLRLTWLWRNGEWDLLWMFFGHRYRKTKNDWSPHEQGFMSDRDIDLPAWVLPLIDANAPTMTPTVGGAAELRTAQAEVEQRGKDLATWQHVAGQHQATMFDAQAERDRLRRGMRDLHARWLQRSIDNGDYYNRTAAKYEHGKAVAFDAAAKEIHELIGEQAPDSTGGA